jgi:hypothetical protein
MVERLFCLVKTKNCPSLTAMRLLQICNDDLSHLEYGIHHPFGFDRVRVTHQLAQRLALAASGRSVDSA